MTGIPAQTIIKKLRTSRWIAGENPLKQPRVCFVTLRDIANIASRYGLIEGRSCEDDRISLKMLLENRDDISAVKLIETDNPSGDGFVLEIRVKRNCFDDTFHVTRYAFRLATLLISDDAGNGFPCAHLLSYRMSAAEIRILFELVKECIPQFETQYLMTDDTHVFYNAFKSVFPHSRAFKLLCAFHIKQAFKRKHKEYLRAANMDTANDLIGSILSEVDPVKFESG
ncbi:hypothetical protein Y032_1503g3899, partial [Ancylostoma ceylanicum]